MIKYNAGVDPNKLDKKLKSVIDIFVKAVDFDITGTSGLRSPAENKQAGGVANSSHLRGQAIDIACQDSFQRYKLVFGALASGFKRIGIAKDHVHLDIDETKPFPIIFFDGI